MGKRKKKRTWLARLFDMKDTSVSASTVFMITTSVVATFLLIVPAIVLLIEVCYNHTILTDLTGMGAYISAVVALYASGGLVKGWTNYSNYKFNSNPFHPDENEIDDDTDEDNPNITAE
ncbi:MAG: hypothetical protein [Wendovervirus sonii]|uniref:Holin n=1 Tax=phage Lak_Megaphage_Sonny TaxID=3109229 RepID=A0ABZ0Z3F5_9CAUD|nr:MAG: hypothetical protein [phage Lak_Megaphage_Sonny]